MTVRHGLPPEAHSRRKYKLVVYYIVDHDALKSPQRERVRTRANGHRSAQNGDPGADRLRSDTLT